MQVDVPRFEHAKDQLCGKPNIPVSTWVPAILLYVYSLARASSQSKTVHEKPQLLPPGASLRRRILVSLRAYRWDNPPFRKIVALGRMR